jgi:hypothetical protein
MVSEILLTLKSLHYSGDCRNFMVDKYCTAHVNQHNCHAALSKWNVKLLEETMMIHYFEGGITYPSFASIKSMIMVDYQKFQDFDAVMWLYINCKHFQKAETPTHQACKSLLSKVAEMADKAVRDVGEVDKVEQMAQREMYPKKKLIS